MRPDRHTKLIAVLQLLLAAGFVGFWALYFSEKTCRAPVELCAPGDKGCLTKILQCERYVAFENAFPVPDLGYVVPMLLAGAVGLLKNRRYGILCSLVAGSALIFLGLLDVSFNLQNGRYTIDVSEGAMNILINTVCLVFGPLLIWQMWRRLAAFFEPHS